MKLSPILGVPIAQQNDARRDFPTQVDDPRTLALEKATAPRFATTAARDAAYTAAGGPVDGQQCWITPLKQMQARVDGLWIPVAGQMPSMRVQWAAASRPSGISGLTAAPSASNYKGLSTSPINAANGAVTLPYAGRWLINLNSAISGQAAGAAIAQQILVDAALMCQSDDTANGSTMYLNLAYHDNTRLANQVITFAFYLSAAANCGASVAQFNYLGYAA